MSVTLVALYYSFLMLTELEREYVCLGEYVRMVTGSVFLR